MQSEDIQKNTIIKLYISTQFNIKREKKSLWQSDKQNWLEQHYLLLFRKQHIGLHCRDSQKIWILEDMKITYHK